MLFTYVFLYDQLVKLIFNTMVRLVREVGTLNAIIRIEDYYIQEKNLKANNDLLV